MKILSFCLIILSLSKLFILGSFEKQELAKDLYYSLRNNFDSFQKKATYVIAIDSIIGLACGLSLLLC